MVDEHTEDVHHHQSLGRYRLKPWWEHGTYINMDKIKSNNTKF